MAQASRYLSVCSFLGLQKAHAHTRHTQTASAHGVEYQKHIPKQQQQKLNTKKKKQKITNTHTAFKQTSARKCAWFNQFVDAGGSRFWVILDAAEIDGLLGCQMAAEPASNNPPVGCFSIGVGMDALSIRIRLTFITTQ